ncbi:MAG: glycosyltransferase family 2 protein [Nitrospirota bacterium]
MGNKKERIAANIPTYNRKQLLGECLDALLNQTYPLDAIYIIDNASTDGTPEFLLERGFINVLLTPDKEPIKSVKAIPLPTFPDKTVEIHYVRMPENTGSAGGYYEGIKMGYKAGFDWLWLMDNDGEPREDALEMLLKAIKSICYQEKKIGFLVSKVIWKDYKPHHMNLPQISSFAGTLPFNLFDASDLYLVKAASYTSAIISRDAVAHVGYPIKEFVIWFDDIEYTSRIVSAGFLGVYVPKSICIHKTPENYSANIYTDKVENLWRYNHEIRNRLFVIKSKSLLKFLGRLFDRLLVINLKLLVKRKQNKLSFIIANTRATIAAIGFKPKIEKPC